MFKVVASRMIAPNMHLLTMEAPNIAREAQPGQFAILRAEEEGERIPLSIADWDTDLGKKAGAGSHRPVAENVDGLNFIYFDAAGSTPVANPEDIRSVQITLVARSGRDVKYTDTRAYANDQGTVILSAQNDNFRRRLLTGRVQYRNMGI